MTKKVIRNFGGRNLDFLQKVEEET